MDKENTAPTCSLSADDDTLKKVASPVGGDNNFIYFSIFSKGGQLQQRDERGPNFVLQCPKKNQNLRSFNQLSTASYQDGAYALLATRYIREESTCEHFQVHASSKNSAFQSSNVKKFYSELGNQMRVVLASEEMKGSDSDLSLMSANDTLILITANGEECTFTFTVCLRKTFDIWMNVVSKYKLYLGIDLDRTVIDSYTLEGLEKLIQEQNSSEREKSFVLAHALALEHFNRKGDIPPFMRMIYGSTNVKFESGAIYVDRGRGSKLIFTRYPRGTQKYPNGTPVLFWIRPGWDVFLDSIKDRYFTCFITQSSSIHAALALKVLKLDVLQEEKESGVRMLTVCRKDKKLITKAFHLTGAGAEKCFVGLDDLCDGSDELHSNLDGVSIWNRGDLRVILKPVPYHAYSEQAGQSDATPLEMCSHLLSGIHERFFASLNKAVEGCKSHSSTLSCSLAKVEDIVSYYARNNTTSSQAMASFIETVIQKFNK